MNCKNCQTELVGEKKFCTNCGGKVINHRFNFKMVFEEFFSTFISWDNTFFKTLIHSYTKPQEVVNGYLDGVRKRYMQPFAYMVIALTLYGIYMVLAKDVILEYVTASNLEIKKMFENFGLKIDEKFIEDSLKTNKFLLKYSNYLTFISIPIIAIANFIIFKKRNFIEHNIALLYSYASYIFGFLTIVFIGFMIGISFSTTYTISSIFLIVYHIYFYKKMFNLSISETLLKTLLFWLLFTAIIVFTFFLVFLIGVLVGKFFR